jgi:tetratricopeptide (TPR) repeat protein
VSSTEEGIWAPLSSPGPGYNHPPRQVLLYGHGDAWERGRLLIQLARQVGIEMIMLGIDEGGRTSTAQPWAAGALLNDQLYLLEPQLGLAIPGPQGKGVATLAQLREDPQLLRQLDAKKGSELFRYPMKAEDLKHVVGLIDASAEALSLRMHLIEQRLTGEDKLDLTIAPTPVEQRIRQSQGINIGLWTIPFDTAEHRRRLALAASQDLSLARKFFKTEAPYQGNQVLAKARRMHFRGIWESEASESQEGAKPLYINARMPTDVLENLDSDEDLQKELGLFRRPDEDPANWQVRVGQIKAIYHTARVDSTYFLALAHYEDGDYGDAIKWFQRTRQVDEEDRWENAIHYNEARTYEAMRNWRQAAILYRTDRSPQVHGNLLRAQMLETVATAAVQAAGTEE